MTPREEIELCLEPLTVLDCTPEEGVAIAAAAGCRLASVWVQPPGVELPAQCFILDDATVRRVRRSLAENGVRPLNLEAFDIAPDTDISQFRSALERGAELGAVGASAIFRNNPDPAHRADQLGELCELAAPFKLRVNVEFISYRTLSTLEEAVDLIARAGRPNAGITVDLLHLARSGGTPDQLRRVDPKLIGHAQLCDGPATIDPDQRLAESIGTRLAPGEGELPVRAFVEALPPMPVGLEVPWKTPTLQGLTPLERVQRIVRSTRRALAGEAAGAR
jgi:sugar phosphate isomerase/epimerase